ncbi:type II toxin-antitoxin system antitoxin HipB [Leclercia pneumoniae]|jgi:HTH-type transcriptional regulator / antitoxin HipB|uniref:type II toxin-antitoxin system antitoxin HipB n=1 Tax=Leclercia TaxID=83654 RepID=UPI001F177B2A|nr:type II toxin-antitoxin system antitoxin HipB [Leclercia pneumoniae]MCE6964528.1 type II toxin-antitoxin system antitoxin HipB [Enterobacter sp. MW07]MCV2512096.1 type II toxin-antitoxin system antitoxin HipB [Leclercia pneumoniae]MEB7499631.1 type II toxin-antitoxin system antitoxin HipB [Leclercia pneumoniae]WNN83168.1 type II toxin-antitoxin system antitoxin HipB [Leclercia pneumoniae]
MKPPMIYSPVQLANYLKLTRQKNNWTQSELARKIGIKQATVSNFENNPDNITLTTFFKLLQALELTMVLYEKGETVEDSTSIQQQDVEW